MDKLKELVAYWRSMEFITASMEDNRDTEFICAEQLEQALTTLDPLEEAIAIVKLDAIREHLNYHDGKGASALLVDAVKRVELAAEWAARHIEERGKQNDELRQALATREQPGSHTDDIHVDGFALCMKRKLKQKRGEGYGGWDNPQECKVGHLAHLFVEHIGKGDPIDLANFAMMLHYRIGGSEALKSEWASVRPVTGNAPPRCPACGGEMPCDFCGTPQHLPAKESIVQRNDVRFSEEFGTPYYGSELEEDVPEYLTALESGLDNETQEQFIERTGIVQPPSVRPVTGNAPKVRLTEDQVRSALIVAGDYCGMSHVRLQTEELNRILALAGTPDQASERPDTRALDKLLNILNRWRVDADYTSLEVWHDIASLMTAAKEPRS